MATQNLLRVSIFGYRFNRVFSAVRNIVAARLAERGTAPAHRAVFCEIRGAGARFFQIVVFGPRYEFNSVNSFGGVGGEAKECDE